MRIYGLGTWGGPGQRDRETGGTEPGMHTLFLDLDQRDERI